MLEKSSTVSAILNNSLFLRLCLEEIRQIQRFKWLESEKCGHDIGDYKAHMDWLRKHHNKWQESFLHENESLKAHCARRNK